MRVLVDRLWPRGVRREAVDVWMREVAPSDELRRWFSHDPARWEEFKARYWRELDGNPKVAELLELARRGDVTLLYAARSPTTTPRRSGSTSSAGRPNGGADLRSGPGRPRRAEGIYIYVPAAVSTCRWPMRLGASCWSIPRY